jgi:predicted phosphoribosyltransferase
MNGKVIDEPAYRNKFYVFRDRFEAGELLAAKLLRYRGADACILAIPAGGVQVASVVAKTLGLPMDLAITRKIHIPWDQEAGFGAVTWDGVTVLNEPLVSALGLAEDTVERCIREEKEVVERRQEIFRGKKPFPSLEGKIVIVVDDGLASGFSMLATLISVKRRDPKEIVVAIPTASPDAVERIKPHADKIICLNVRSLPVFAVADAYRNWYDLDDREVMDILEKMRK